MIFFGVHSSFLCCMDLSIIITSNNSLVTYQKQNDQSIEHRKDFWPVWIHITICTLNLQASVLYESECVIPKIILWVWFSSPTRVNWTIRFWWSSRFWKLFFARSVIFLNFILLIILFWFIIFLIITFWWWHLQLVSLTTGDDGVQLQHTFFFYFIYRLVYPVTSGIPASR